MLTLAPIVDASTCLSQFCLSRRQSALMVANTIVLWMSSLSLLRLTSIRHATLRKISLVILAPIDHWKWKSPLLLTPIEVLVAPIELLVAPVGLWLAPIVLVGLAPIRHSIWRSISLLALAPII